MIPSTTAPRRPTSNATSRPARGTSFHWVPLVLALMLLAAVAQVWRTLAMPLMDRLNQASPPNHPASTNGLLAVFHPQVLRWSSHIQAWANATDLPPALIATVMQIESCGDPAAASPAGAAGLFQVMPYHFLPGEDPLDPETNARRGLDYLAGALRLAGGDPALALAGYNGGHSQIGRQPANWPTETQRYVRWGTALLEDVAAERLPSPGLIAWLAAGGEWLCQQAAARSSLTLLAP